MIQKPVLLNVELQGAVVVLLVQGLDGSTLRVRCGTREAYRVRSWQWLRNSTAGNPADNNPAAGSVTPGSSAASPDPCGFLTFTEFTGREFRFAVPTEAQLSEIQQLMRRPEA